MQQETAYMYFCQLPNNLVDTHRCDRHQMKCSCDDSSSNKEKTLQLQYTPANSMSPCAFASSQIPRSPYKDATDVNMHPEMVYALVIYK